MRYEEKAKYSYYYELINFTKLFVSSNGTYSGQNDLLNGLSDKIIIVKNLTKINNVYFEALQILIPY